MDKQIITFTANEQCLRKTGGLEVFATKTVSYIEAHFDLGTNWSGYDSVRAVWWNDYVRPISTVLDSDGVCIVPPEVLLRKGTVYVNLVGSIAEGDVLTDRLTTIPITALVEKFNAHVDSTETAPITPSQFEQFVSIVQDAVANIKDIVSTTLNADYTLTFVYSDGTSYTTPSIRGERGPQGADGADGTDGNGIASAVLNSNYTLTLTFTDGTSYTTPSIRGAQGPKGDPGDVSQAQLDAAVSDLKSDLNDVFTISIIKGTNRLNPATITSGAYIANSESIVSQSGYGYSDYIEVEEGDTIRCTYWSNISSNRGLFYNSNKEKVSAITAIADLTDYTGATIPYWECTVPSGATYVRVNVRPAYISTNWMVTLNVAFPSEYVAYVADVVDKHINSDVVFTLPYYPKLYGKNIMFCGDSITYGAYADEDASGAKKNFGYYIEKSTGCNALFNAVSGSTMMNVVGKSPFSVNRYQQLGSGLDYIVLAFSTNDSAESTDLIGSYSDTTNETFWGAWKIVLNYLIQTYPTAKIGIIGFWRGNQNYLYTDALREIAQKFRIPLLDFMFDANVPMVGGTDFRSYNPNAPFTVDYNTLVARQEAFLHDTVHPNDAGYQYLAPIIQAYLERL